MKTILKVLLSLLSLAWSSLKKKLRNSAQVMGTHLQIGLAGVTFILMIINTQQVKQVKDNSSEIKKVKREILDFRDSLRVSDQVKEAQIDSMHREVKRMQEISLKQDQTVAQVIKDLQELKANRSKAMETIDGFTNEQLVEFFKSKSVRKK
jgi:hypothetical protein